MASEKWLPDFKTSNEFNCATISTIGKSIGKAVLGKEDEILCVMFQELIYSRRNTRKTTGSFRKIEDKNTGPRDIHYKNGREWKRV